METKELAAKHKKCFSAQARGILNNWNDNLKYKFPRLGATASHSAAPHVQHCSSFAHCFARPFHKPQGQFVFTFSSFLEPTMMPRGSVDVIYSKYTSLWQISGFYFAPFWCHTSFFAHVPFILRPPWSSLIFSHPFLPLLRLLVLFLLGIFQLGDLRGKLCQLSGLHNHAHKWKKELRVLLI